VRDDSSSRVDLEQSTSNKTLFMKFVTLIKEKSTLTLTQSGLLAVLLEHQRRNVIEMGRRRAHRDQVRAAFWSAFTKLWANARRA